MVSHKNTSALLAFRILIMGLLLFLTVTPLLQAQEAPFKKGVNVTNWFQANSAREVQFTKYTRQDFVQIKSLGADVIRLPINLHAMTQGAPNYTIDPLLFTFLDQAITWAEELNLHLILDNHSFNPIANTQPEVEIILANVWPQLARRYKNRSDKLYYEILNEPHGIADELWNGIQGRIIQVIRAEDTKHTIIVGASNFNSYQNLAQMPVYPDNKLIYTFHFYDPFLFTHQGASWVEPSLVPLANMPFPYRAQDMPALPSSLRGTWLEGAYNNYGNEGTVARVKQLIDIAANFKQTRQVPVFCGEFGVYMKNSRPQDRVFWHETVRRYLEEKGIAWTTWDYHHEFGLFTQGGSDLFDHDLNVPLLQALGFTVPPQTPYQKSPKQVGFGLYSDYLGKDILNASYGGQLNFYADQKPNNGHFSLSWANADQYSSIGFDFRPEVDLSVLRQNNYALDFLFRATGPATRLDLRFLDTKTADPNDHPWRSVFTLTEQLAPFDGRWHHIRIPLTSFQEQGSWDNNAWHTPRGAFDWTNIDKMEITAEHGPLGTTQFWFDNVYISNQDTAKIYDTSVYTGPLSSLQEQNASPDLILYPNPASTILKIEATKPEPLTLELMDTLGKTWAQRQFQGKAQINTAILPNGVYFLKVTSPTGRSSTHKILVQH
ncbi:cellulase family glycosylhydrolase [Rufibacter sp. LB8]|uniref:cellulase family glycosylhydrolase n=1 Tax=Rufibacter sp. LB8 TaxID=2777781 RepID=UPI00178C5C83|nr:cellulase family glycosylhydrolase [Rufibacter sp. LB8]